MGSLFPTFYSHLKYLLIMFFSSIFCNYSLVPFYNNSKMNHKQSLAIEYLDEYQIIKQLGSGYQAIVYLALDTCGVRVAIKKFKHMPTSNSNVEEQLAVMQNLHHQNLIKLISIRPNAVFRNRYDEEIQCFAFVIQFAQGGELFDFIAETGRFSERVARTYFHQMMNGIHYMHEKGYAHRDIKPENLLLSDAFVLKIADFGFSCLLKGRDGRGLLKTKLGTQGYMAPEISTKQYEGRKVDIFAAGVILFIMYSGNPPFEKATPNDPFYRLIKDNKLQTFWQAHSRKRRAGFYSATFKDLFQKMTAQDPNVRPTIFEIAKHPWVKSSICTHSEIVNQFKERRNRLEEVLRARMKVRNGQQLSKIESESSTESISQVGNIHISFSQLYCKQAMQGYTWKVFPQVHQPDIVINKKDQVYVLTKLKEFLPKQSINLNLRAHTEVHNEDEQQDSGDLAPKIIEDGGNKIHIIYHYNSLIHHRTISHQLRMEIEVGRNSEGLTVIHFQQQTSHLYFKLIIANIKNECFA